MRRKNLEVAEKERLALEALAGIKLGKYKSGSEAARCLDHSVQKTARTPITH